MKQSLEEKIRGIALNITIGLLSTLDNSKRNWLKDEIVGQVTALLEEETLNTDKVTRVEVIDHTKDFEEGGGRAYVNWKDTNKVELSFQDEGRTLKVFISNQQDKQE